MLILMLGLILVLAMPAILVELRHERQSRSAAVPGRSYVRRSETNE